MRKEQVKLGHWQIGVGPGCATAVKEGILASLTRYLRMIMTPPFASGYFSHFSEKCWLQNGVVRILRKSRVKVDYCPACVKSELSIVAQRSKYAVWTRNLRAILTPPFGVCFFPKKVACKKEWLESYVNNESKSPISRPASGRGGPAASRLARGPV